MPHVATSPADLLTTLRGAAHLDRDLIVIDDDAVFRDTAIRDLAWTAAFSDDEAVIAHVEGCADCRAELDRLAVKTDLSALRAVRTPLPLPVVAFE